MKDLRPLLVFAAPHRLLLAASAALMLCESAAALGVPWVAGLLTQGILASGPGGQPVGPVLLAMLALFAAQAMTRFGSAYLLETAASRIEADLKVRLYDHLQALPLDFYQQRRLGDTLALMTNDVYHVGAFISGTAVALAPLIVTAGGAALLMFHISPALALLAVVLVPLFFLLLKVVGRRLRPLSVQIQDEEASAIAIAHENLGMLPAIKTFTREAQESARYRGQIDRILDLSARQRRINAGLAPMVQFIAAGGIVMVFALASTEVAEGTMSAAQLVSFLLYAQLLARPVAGLADVYGRAQAVRGALSRVLRVMAEPPEASGKDGPPMPPINGQIEFRAVGFGYPGRPAALDRVDFRIAAGETIAIVGPNGAGKSTIAHLLMRLHDPGEGKIFIDGIDIASVSLESLRRQIGVVPQHVMLFNAPVRDNIAYGRPDPSQGSIQAAARAARADGFIAELPQGYDTMVGDNGVRLSGGQQQRLALARALLKDPPILILDEATAMFDPEGEEEFLQACRETFRRRTVIFITHRPASLRVADRIVHMRDGRIELVETRAERGPRLVAGG